MIDAEAAQARWELENTVQPGENVEGYYVYNAAEQQALQVHKPWAKDPNFFKQ